MFSSFIRLAISQYNARILLRQSVIYCLDINMMGQCTPVPTVRLSRRKHDNEIHKWLADQHKLTYDQFNGIQANNSGDRSKHIHESD